MHSSQFVFAAVLLCATAAGCRKPPPPATRPAPAAPSTRPALSEREVSFLLARRQMEQQGVHMTDEEFAKIVARGGGSATRATALPASRPATRPVVQPPMNPLMLMGRPVTLGGKPVTLLAMNGGSLTYRVDATGEIALTPFAKVTDIYDPESGRRLAYDPWTQQFSDPSTAAIGRARVDKRERDLAAARAAAADARRRQDEARALEIEQRAAQAREREAEQARASAAEQRAVATADEALGFLFGAGLAQAAAIGFERQNEPELAETARFGRDKLLEQALIRACPEWDGVERRAAVRALANVVDDGLDLEKFKADTFRDELIEHLKGRDSTVGGAAEVADIINRILTSNGRQPIRLPRRAATQPSR